VNCRYRLFKNIASVLFASTILVPNILLAQTTRTLEGRIDLDVGSAVKDLALDIVVNNHSFVVLPPAFTIVRPIQSSVITRVNLIEGQNSVSYFLNDIINDPVDYTVQIRCIGCADIIPTQIYTPEGNQFGFPNAAFIDPGDLPAQLNLNAISRAVISGQITLQNPAERDLSFTISIIDPANPNIILATNGSLEISAGDSNIDYQFTNLARSNDSFQVQFRCKNCFGHARSIQTFERLLSAQTNHSNIDFTLSDAGQPITLTAIYLLLLGQ